MTPNNIYSFFIWHFLLNIMAYSFVSCLSVVFLFCCVVSIVMGILHFVYSFYWLIFDSFQVGAIINQTIVGVLLQDILWAYALIYLGYTLRRAVAGSWHTFNFIGNGQPVFHGARTVLSSCQQCVRRLFLPTVALSLLEDNFIHSGGHVGVSAISSDSCC